MEFESSSLYYRGLNQVGLRVAVLKTVGRNCRVGSSPTSSAKVHVSEWPKVDGCNPESRRFESCRVLKFFILIYYSYLADLMMKKQLHLPQLQLRLDEDEKGM